MSKNTNNKNQSGIFLYDFPTNVGNDLLDNQKRLIRSSSSNTRNPNTTSSKQHNSLKTTFSSSTKQISSKRNTRIYNNNTGQILKNYVG